MPLVRHLVQGRGDEQGQGLVEYALILTLVAIVVIVALAYLGSTVSETLSRVGGSV